MLKQAFCTAIVGLLITQISVIDKLHTELPEIELFSKI